MGKINVKSVTFKTKYNGGFNFCKDQSKNRKTRKYMYSYKCLNNTVL